MDFMRKMTVSFAVKHKLNLNSLIHFVSSIKLHFFFTPKIAKKQERGLCRHRRDGKDGVDETPFRVSVIFFFLLLWYITSFFQLGRT